MNIYFEGSMYFWGVLFFIMAAVGILCFDRIPACGLVMSCFPLNLLDFLESYLVAEALWYINSFTATITDCFSTILKVCCSPSSLALLGPLYEGLLVAADWCSRLPSWVLSKEVQISLFQLTLFCPWIRLHTVWLLPTGPSLSLWVSQLEVLGQHLHFHL